MTGGLRRADQVNATREAILAAAERLFAEHGVITVSNRQISEAAGQGNNTAVGYHFGTKTDLVMAIVRRHTDDIERIRARMVAEAVARGAAAGLRDWVTCLVGPNIEHLASLPAPTYFARFSAQVMADPALRDLMVDESLAAPSLHQALAALDRYLTDLPETVRSERNQMGRQLIMQMTAERERALAEGRPTPRASWADAAVGLIDATIGLWQAPVTMTR